MEILLYIFAATVLLGLTAIPIVFYTMIIRQRIEEKRERKEQSRLAREAINRIMADGKVEGPKGPYVPHKRWKAGTPSETRGLKNKARYDEWH